MNENDPVYLFVTDKFGKNLRQLSPKNYDLNRWELAKNSNKIILSASRDSNQNKEFDNEDEVSVFEIDLNVNELSREIFTDDFKKELKTLYAKDWKRIK